MKIKFQKIISVINNESRRFRFLIDLSSNLQFIHHMRLGHEFTVARWSRKDHCCAAESLDHLRPRSLARTAKREPDAPATLQPSSCPRESPRRREPALPRRPATQAEQQQLIAGPAADRTAG